MNTAIIETEADPGGRRECFPAPETRPNLADRNRGVTYCPHCDGPLFKGKRVAVIGGGNSGVEAAIDLAGVVAHVTVLEWMGELKADEILLRRLRSLPNVDIITMARTTEVLGNGNAGSPR